MCSDMASRGCGTRGEARVRNRAGLLWQSLFRPGRSLLSARAKRGDAAGFPRLRPNFDGLNVCRLRRSSRLPGRRLNHGASYGHVVRPGAQRVAVAFRLELPRRFSRDSSGLARRPMEGPSAGAMVPSRSSKSATCRRVRCDARARGRRDAGSKRRGRAPRAADSAAGCAHNGRGAKERVIVAECTARFHLVDVLSSLTDEASASGAARGAVRRRRWEKRHARNVTAMKNARADRGARNPTPIIRRGEMRCGKRLLRVSCQTRPCHARGDGASSPASVPMEGGSERSAAGPRAEAHCSADDHRDGCAQIAVALVATSIRLADK